MLGEMVAAVLTHEAVHGSSREERKQSSIKQNRRKANNEMIIYNARAGRGEVKKLYMLMGTK